MLLRSTSHLPSVSVSRFDAILNNVDLPQPDGPKTVTNSPGLISKETPPRALVQSGNVMPTLLNARAAATRKE